MSEDPPRWGTSDEAPEPLRRLLAASRTELGATAQIDALALSLSRALGPAAGLGAAVTRQQALSPRRLGSLRSFGAAAAVGSAATLWWAFSATPVAAPPIAPLQTPTPALLAPAAPVPPAPSATPSAPILPAADLAVDPSATSAIDVVDVGSEVEPAAASAHPRARHALPSEAALLERARAALREHPARALALTREHQRRFPHGALREEREVIAIEALERLGQHRAAGDEAGGFEKRYRNSVHRERLEQAPRTEPADRPSR